MMALKTGGNTCVNGHIVMVNGTVTEKVKLKTWIGSVFLNAKNSLDEYKNTFFCKDNFDSLKDKSHTE